MEKSHIIQIDMQNGPLTPSPGTILGGAPYANIMAPELREYAENLDPAMVGRIVLFTTSNWSRRTVLALKKIFKGKDITVSEDYFYAHMLNIDGKIEAAKKFGAENC